MPGNLAYFAYPCTIKPLLLSFLSWHHLCEEKISGSILLFHTANYKVGGTWEIWLRVNWGVLFGSIATGIWRLFVHHSIYGFSHDLYWNIYDYYKYHHRTKLLYISYCYECAARVNNTNCTKLMTFSWYYGDTDCTIRAFDFIARSDIVRMTHSTWYKFWCGL